MELWSIIWEDQMIKDKTAAKIFGNRLKGLMKERGITNAELADVFEVSEKVIERWCEGLSSPNIDNLILVAKLFNVRVDYMLVVID